MERLFWAILTEEDDPAELVWEDQENIPQVTMLFETEEHAQRKIDEVNACSGPGSVDQWRIVRVLVKLIQPSEEV